MRRIIYLTCLLGLLSSSCQKSNCPNPEKAIFKDATGIGGCGVVIELPSGKFLEPRNLNDFEITQEDGKKIWVTYHLRETGGTVCMIGDMIEIDCISER